MKPGYSAEEMAGDFQRENNRFAAAAAGGQPGRLPNAQYATVQRGNTLEGIADGDRELMGRYIAGMGLDNPNLLQPGQALMANWDMSSGDAVALANRHYATHAQARAAAMGSMTQAASPLAQVLSYSQSYPALAREADGYDQLVAAGLMTRQQAQDSLLASPRAYATLRSDYETPAVAPAGGPSLVPWDGVTRLSPAETYLAKARGGLDAVRGDALHFRVAQSLPDAAALAVGDLAVARVAGLLGRAAAPVHGLMFGERAMLMSSWRAEMGVGLAADLPAMSGLAAEAVRIPGAVPVRFDKLLGKTGTPAAVDAAIGGNPLSKLPDPYQGVRDASAYLKSMGVDRATRVQVLQSFDVSTMSVEAAGDNLFGLRFHDFGENARPLGSYLFETFTPQTNRAGLALPYEWNEMTGIKQWQVTPGTTYLRGIAAPQLDFGLQYTGGAEQMYILQPWKYGSLK